MTLIEKLRLDWIWLRLSYSFRWAHHPTCDPYNDQRFDIEIRTKVISLCQGCTLLTIGTVISFILISVLMISNVIMTVFPLIGITIFTVITVSIIDGNNLSRMYKRFARILLGISAGATFATILFYPDWVIKVAVLIILIGSIALYSYFRSMNPSEDLCQSCNYLDDVPYCPGLTDQMIANKQYQELALPVIGFNVQKQLDKKFTNEINRFGGQNNEEENIEPSPKLDPSQYNVIWVDNEE